MRVRLLEFYTQPGFQLLCSLGSLSGLGLSMYAFYLYPRSVLCKRVELSV